MYPTKVIKITKLDTKNFTDNVRYNIVDESGDKYNFKEKKADGNTTKAFTAFQTVGVNVGGTYEITYNEQRKEWEGRNYTDRVIFDFKPTNGLPTTQASSQPKSSNGGANTASQSKSDEFWEQQAYEKCESLWIASMIQKGVDIDTLKMTISRGDFWDLFQCIKQDGARRFSNSKTPANEPSSYDKFKAAGENLKSETSAPFGSLNNPLPEEELNVSDIPF